MIMKPSWPTMADGCMRDPMDTFGFPMSTTTPGGRITTEDGSGTRFVDGLGVHMSHGDGVFLIMADGIGELIWDGTGSRAELGGQPGCTGITDTIISVGAL